MSSAKQGGKNEQQKVSISEKTLTSISSSLAIKLVERSIRKGYEPEIPSLGIKRHSEKYNNKSH